MIWGHRSDGRNRVHVLTDKQCRAVGPGAKPLKLFDGHGLHLFVSPSGFKGWRLKYRFEGREKQLTFGPFPQVTLREARDLTQAALSLLRKGQDPAQREQVAASITFREAALRWHALQQPGWKPKHAADVLTSLENELFPALGARPLAAIRPAEVRELLEAVQARGATETAHRLRGRTSAVFQLAIARGEAEIDPAASLKAVLRPITNKLRPALVTLPECRALLTALEALPLHPGTVLASRLLALTAVRPGMIRFAEAGEFEDLGGAQPLWRVPAAKMKLSRLESEQKAFDFVVPLSAQAAATVRAALALAGQRRYLFPSHWHSHRPLSETALVDAYLRVPGNRGKHVPHGWRASFATIMNERAALADRPGDRAVIDLMLAHQPRGVEARYNRAAFMPQRRAIAQDWADLLLDGLIPADELTLGPRR